MLTSAPWRKAPLLLWRTPVVALAVAGAMAVLALTSGATPLFLSSAGAAAQTKQISERCVGTAGATLVPEGDLNRFTARVDELAVTFSHLGSPVVTRTGNTLSVSSSPGELVGYVKPMFRTGAEDHVELLAGGTGPGLLVPQSIVDGSQLSVGQTAVLSLGDNHARARVSGVYSDLTGRPLSDYWCSKNTEINALGLFTENRPPPLLLMDEKTFDDLYGTLGQFGGKATVELPLSSARLTLNEGEELVQDLERLDLALGADAGGVDSVTRRSDHVRSVMPFVTGRSAAIVASLRSSTTPVAAGGVLTAIVLVGGAGSYWAERRKRELLVLASRGVPLARWRSRPCSKSPFPPSLGRSPGGRWPSPWSARSAPPTPSIPRLSGSLPCSQVWQRWSAPYCSEE